MARLPDPIIVEQDSVEVVLYPKRGEHGIDKWDITITTTDQAIAAHGKNMPSIISSAVELAFVKLGKL